MSAGRGICLGVVCTAYFKKAAGAVAGMGAPSGWCQCLVHWVVNMAGVLTGRQGRPWLPLVIGGADCCCSSSIPGKALQGVQGPPE